MDTELSVYIIITANRPENRHALFVCTDDIKDDNSDDIKDNNADNNDSNDDDTIRTGYLYQVSGRVDQPLGMYPNHQDYPDPESRLDYVDAWCIGWVEQDRYKEGAILEVAKGVMPPMFRRPEGNVMETVENEQMEEDYVEQESLVWTRELIRRLKDQKILTMNVKFVEHRPPEYILELYRDSLDSTYGFQATSDSLPRSSEFLPRSSNEGAITEGEAEAEKEGEAKADRMTIVQEDTGPREETKVDTPTEAESQMEVESLTKARSQREVESLDKFSRRVDEFKEYMNALMRSQEEGTKDIRERIEAVLEELGSLKDKVSEGMSLSEAISLQESERQLHAKEDPGAAMDVKGGEIEPS
jgi:hypothetical protein